MFPSPSQSCCRPEAEHSPGHNDQIVDHMEEENDVGVIKKIHESCIVIEK